MSLLEQLQQDLGKAWTVEGELPESHEIEWAEDTDVPAEAFEEALEKVLDHAHRDCERRMVPFVDSIWASAEALLGESKYKGLVQHFEEDMDSLDVDTVVAALLGSVSSQPSGVIISAGPDLLEAYANYHERASDRAATEWGYRAETTWTQFLPTEFGIRRLPDETPNEFRTRVVLALKTVAGWYPIEESTTQMEESER